MVAQQRKALLQRIAAEGFEAVVEAMAYTWFNRFVALRFMEVHGYLDHAERVTLPGLDPQQVIQLKLDGNRDTELYRLLLVAQCNALHQAIPFVLGKIASDTASFEGFFIGKDGVTVHRTVFRLKRDSEVIEFRTDACEGGCSGGPLFTADGHLIGVHTNRGPGLEKPGETLKEAIGRRIDVSLPEIVARRMEWNTLRV